MFSFRYEKTVFNPSLGTNSLDTHPTEALPLIHMCLTYQSAENSKKVKLPPAFSTSLPSLLPALAQAYMSHRHEYGFAIRKVLIQVCSLSPECLPVNTHAQHLQSCLEFALHVCSNPMKPLHVSSQSLETEQEEILDMCCMINSLLLFPWTDLTCMPLVSQLMVALAKQMSLNSGLDPDSSWLMEAFNHLAEGWVCFIGTHPCPELSFSIYHEYIQTRMLLARYDEADQFEDLFEDASQVEDHQSMLAWIGRDASSRAIHLLSSSLTSVLNGLLDVGGQDHPVYVLNEQLYWLVLSASHLLADKVKG